LNLHHLSTDSFWGDEILTATFANRSPSEVIRWTAGDIHPPLYYLLVGSFVRLLTALGTASFPTPSSDWLWRFPSVLAGVLTVAVTYRLVRLLVETWLFQEDKSHARSIATATALLLCFAPIAIKYNQEARMHALFMFLSVLTTWFFFRGWAQQSTNNPSSFDLARRWLPFALATTANLYTVYFGFLILATQVVFSILELGFQNPKSKIQNFFGFSLAVIIALGLYLPWWSVLFKILSRRAAVGAIEGGVGTRGVFLFGVIKSLGPLPEVVAWGFFGCFIMGLFLLARRYWPIAVFAAMSVALPATLPILLGDPRALQFRYAFVLPIYLWVIVYAVWGIREKEAKKFILWLLITLSFIATLGIYQQTKPNWRDAAAYLNEHVSPADFILIGPLWDEGRFIGYYYHGQAPLLPPAVLVANVESYSKMMRQNNGRIWAVNCFAPKESPALQNIAFSGVVLSEPRLTVYEADLITHATLDLAAQAVEAAYPWAAEAESQGVLNPDPRTAKAAALRALGDALVADNRLSEAVTAYQTAVDIFPGWVDGFLALAETQEKMGHLESAAKAYRQAVAFNSKWQSPSADEAAKLVEAGAWDKALEKYHQIVMNKGE